jgi:hypothetical protein
MRWIAESYSVGRVSNDPTPFAFRKIARQSLLVGLLCFLGEEDAMSQTPQEMAAAITQRTRERWEQIKAEKRKSNLTKLQDKIAGRPSYHARGKFSRKPRNDSSKRSSASYLPLSTIRP